MNAGLVDEIRLVFQPIILGSGKPLFKDVKRRHAADAPDGEAVGGRCGLSELQRGSCT